MAGFRGLSQHHTSAFIACKIGNNIFVLYTSTTFNHPLNRGNGVTPYIRVTIIEEEIEEEFERIKRISPASIDQAVVDQVIVDEGGIKLFRFTDPSGNTIEFYSLN